jgi:hypothetical protein
LNCLYFFLRSFMIIDIVVLIEAHKLTDLMSIYLVSV